MSSFTSSRFTSDVFKVESIALGGTFEMMVKGGRDLFPLLPKAFKDIEQIGVIGLGSQGEAQARNLRDSLEGTDIKVVVGLREDSTRRVKARKLGFTEKNGTLDEMYKVIAESDFVILLIKDSAQVENYDKIFATMKPGSILGFSHGFLLGYFDTQKILFPEHISVIGVCPKGMGPSVRRLFEQGIEINGAGINASFAVEQDLDGRAIDVALGWAIAIGAPAVFQTTLREEYISDLFGERAILLGAVWGIVEGLYEYFNIECGMEPEDAFRASVENLTGPIKTAISEHGLLGLYNQFSGTDKDHFERAYAKAYGPFYKLMSEIYDKVKSGEEIKDVVEKGKELEEKPMSKIGDTPMWKIGEPVRELRKREGYRGGINPITTGIYCAGMMAQINILKQNGHRWTEICNESIIEAIDSLLPFMEALGVEHMVDNCSVTARLGTREWGPEFKKTTTQIMADFVKDDKILDVAIEAFKNHDVHAALEKCFEFRPSIDIALEV